MRKCARKTNEEFLEELKNKGVKYIPLGKYKNAKTKIPFRCSECGNIWEISPTNILSGRGCPACRNMKMRKERIYSDFEFKELLHKANPMILTLSTYDGSKNKVLVRCEKHGVEWKAQPTALLRGCGCKECLKEKIADKNSRSHDDFVSIVKQNYPHIEILYRYKNAKSIMKCRCRIHNRNFDKLADSLVRKTGQCPICSMSDGERRVASYLDLHSISYVPEYKFDGNNSIRHKRFDFYLPDINTCIEYDGKQHYEQMPDMGGVSYFEYMKSNDEIKNAFCKENGIRLIRIPYTEDVVEYLNNELSEVFETN